ncbi:MAG: hypothetical protein K9L02_05565 [Acholeplasmataceae bacterium]|nr:hypothetical protein [Acholeplasmataceae bacterium]
MKNVLMITGHLAALKSAIASQLGLDLKILVLSKDKIKEILGDSIGFRNREENLKLSEATYKLILSLMKQTLQVNDEVIIESNFRDYEVEEIIKHCIENQFKLTVIFLTGNPKILYQRYLDRQPLRHPVHTSTGTISYDMFRSSMRPFDPSLYGNHTKAVDTSSFTERDYQNLLKELKRELTNK